MFAFVSLASGDVLSKKLLRSRSKRFSPAVSSRTLMASYLTFRSFSHFEFIFVYGVRKWSRFIFLHVTVQFSHHHLLKRLSLFHWIFFLASSKISCPYVCGPISGFSILFHWSECLSVSVPYCLDEYSFVIQLEVHDSDASCFGFLFQDRFGYSGSFLVPYKF